jgi:MFS family permease
MRGSGLPAVRPGRGEWTDDPAAATLERDMTPAARPVETRLRPLYSTGFIHGFALWYSIEKLFMRSIGLNDYLITIATLVYIVVMIIANIPLGILADRWSRKGVRISLACGSSTSCRSPLPAARSSSLNLTVSTSTTRGRP